MNDDFIAGMQAEADQARAAQRELAQMLHNFYKELREAGMSRKESFELAREMLRSFMIQARLS